MNLSSSAWISTENVRDYIQNKNAFILKNKRKAFKLAVIQIEEAMSEVILPIINNVPVAITNELFDGPISLKSDSVEQIISTFSANESSLRNMFNLHRNQPDRCVRGELDFLTIFHRVVTSEQQKAMYTHIRNAFAENQTDYIHKLNVRKVIHFFS